MMARHDTPVKVARALAKWVPKQARTLLDPSVGSGALLVPLISRELTSLTSVVAVDQDKAAITSVREMFRQIDTPSLTSVCADFTTWQPTKAVPNGGFDCVLMNPPFAARVKVKVSVPGPDGREKEHSTPLEVAFMLKAVALTRPRGRVVAVLPGSVVCAETTAWLRQHLFEMGRFLYVHELPRFTFPGVESRVYLVAFEKAAKHSTIVLCNHSLKSPERIMIEPSAIGPDSRLDFEYYEATRWADDLRAALPDAGWGHLGRLAEISRGARPHSEVPAALHTTAYRDGFWLSARRAKRSTTSRAVEPDLFIQRVGRRCSGSLGLLAGPPAEEWTDCVIQVRATRCEAVRLLFAARPLLGDRLGQRLVEKGSGATYLTVRDLAAFCVPSALADVLPAEFAIYRDAVRSRHHATMLEVEQRVRRLLLESLKPTGLGASELFRRSG